MYRFDIEKEGKLIGRFYNINSVYDYLLGYANEPSDVYVCEYHGQNLYYAWTFKSFINYYKKIKK